MRYLMIGFAALAFAGTAEAKTELGGVPKFWVRVAKCETDGRWDWGKYADSASRRPGEGTTFEGGLGFYSGTWTLWRRQIHVGYQHAWQAPPAIQAEVAAWGLEHGGYWGCMHNGSVDPDGAPSFASVMKVTKTPLTRGLRRLTKTLGAV
jgi:hypothetical protein